MGTELIDCFDSGCAYVAWMGFSDSPICEQGVFCTEWDFRLEDINIFSDMTMQDWMDSPDPLADYFLNSPTTIAQATVPILGDPNYPFEIVGGFVTVNISSYVPIPPAVWLFGSGLLGLIGIARKKTA